MQKLVCLVLLLLSTAAFGQGDKSASVHLPVFPKSVLLEIEMIGPQWPQQVSSRNRLEPQGAELRIPIGRNVTLAYQKAKPFTVAFSVAECESAAICIDVELREDDGVSQTSHLKFNGESTLVIPWQAGEYKVTLKN